MNYYNLNSKNYKLMFGGFKPPNRPNKYYMLVLISSSLINIMKTKS